MKIAILGSRGFPSTYGGYETLVRYLAPQWVMEGHEVTVYCRTRLDGRRKWCVDGVRCIWTPGRDTKSLSTLSFGATSHLDAMWRGYDAVLVLNVANGFFLKLLRGRGIPTVLNTDGIEWERGKWNRIAQKMFYRGAVLAARNADVLVADSKAIARIWKELFSVNARFIPYGAPVVEGVGGDRIRELGLTKRSYILVVARLIPENNVELALDAWEQMGDGGPPVVIVGSANYSSPLESRLKHLDSEGRLRWLGHVGDQDLLTQLWAHCGAYIHGHSVGGTNPALLQALGAGAPTLALDTEFNREVVGADEQLFPKDSVVLAQRLEELLGDSESQQRFAVRGRDTVARKYAWSEVSAAYLKALTYAADRKRKHF